VARPGWLKPPNFAKNGLDLKICRFDCEASMRKPLYLLAVMIWIGAAAALTGASAQTPSDDPNADLEKRLQRLEEQMVDFGAQLGTVETLARGGGAGAGPSAPFQDAGPSAPGGADEGRVANLETQLRALSAQMSDIMRRLDQMERRSGGLAPPAQPDGGARNYGAAQEDAPSDRFSAEPAEQGTGFSVGGDRPPAADGFGATIEPGPGNADRRGGLGGYFDSGSGGRAPVTNAAAGVKTAARSSPQASALYDKAYNELVKRDYRAAAEDFEEFVRNFATDPLAGPAYFWLGEASFTNGQYRKAADSFLKSSTDYPDNEKAAESLLKLGISLKRLGETQAACQTFTELAQRFPNATPILQRADREKSRTQC
jgi:tol-pal system protein YbgF